MCKPIGTNGGRKNYVKLFKLAEVIAAIQLGLDVIEHATLGNVVTCNNWKQAKEYASKIRAAVIG